MTRPARLQDARIQRWDKDDFIPRAHEAMTIYARAMDYSTAVVDGRAGYAATHAGRPGFRSVAALNEDDELLGFGYGYTTAPGQWWHDQVHRALRPDLGAQWLTGSLELCELHVQPEHQGVGLGRELLLTLLCDAPEPTVLLSTPEGDTRAWRLYRSLGFQDLARRYLFPGDGRPFAVLGARLPLSVPHA